MQINRYLKSHVAEWLPQRMVFIGGPRQVGKTHLAKQFLNSKTGYLSWDDLADRTQIKKHQLPLLPSTSVVSGRDSTLFTN